MIMEHKKHDEASGPPEIISGPENRKTSSGFNRRQFLKIGGLTAAAGIAPVGFPAMARAQDLPGTNISPLRLVLPPVPGETQAAVKLYAASNAARMIGSYWKEKYGLEFEPERTRMFSIPGGSTRKIGLRDAIYALQVLAGIRPQKPLETLVESKSSLIGESAYAAFLNDTFINGYAKCSPDSPTECRTLVQYRFTTDQVKMLGDPSRMDMSRDIGKLIDSGLGGPIMAAACCCCCCCCSVCCCSCNDGDQTGGDVTLAAAPFGDPLASTLPAEDLYYRGMMAVMPGGEAVGVALQGRSQDMFVSVMNIAFVGPTGGVQEIGFDPNLLGEIGPEAMAEKIFGGTQF